MAASVCLRAALSFVGWLLCAAHEGLLPAESGEPIRVIRYAEPPTLEVFWRDVYQPGVPVVMKGLVANTPLLERFSSSALRHGPFSEYLHRVVFRRGHGEKSSKNTRSGEARWRFRDVENWLASQPRAKDGGPVMGAGIPQEPCGHEDVLRTYFESLPASLWKPAYDLETNFWVNFNGTPLVSNLHFDPYDNFFMAIEGKKSFQVFPLGQGDRLQTDPNRFRLTPLYGLGGLDAAALRREFLELNPGGAPESARAKGAIVELEPGDVFYLPRTYWHGGLHDGPTIGVNFWWHVICPHEPIFEDFIGRMAPHHDKTAQPDEAPLTPGYERWEFPDPPETVTENFGRESEELMEEGSLRLEPGFLESLRANASVCFRPRVISFDEFEAKLAAIGSGTDCIRDWYARSWEKLARMAEQPPPTSEAALNYRREIEQDGQSLAGKCGGDLDRHDFGYEAMLEQAFPGCQAPHGCDDILRRTRAALRSIVNWERCAESNEL